MAKSSRLAFGAVYIYMSEGFTDVKEREHIQDNPHMQYFCGFDEYKPLPPFDASMMTHFRKRIPAEMITEINEWIFVEEALNQMDGPEPETEPLNTDENEEHDEHEENEGNEDP